MQIKTPEPPPPAATEAAAAAADPTPTTTALHLPSSDEDDLVPPPPHQSIQSMNTMNTNNQYFFSINGLIQQSNVDKIHNKSSIASKTTQIAQQFLVCSHKTQNTSERARERERAREVST
jgi:hypothetical protein